MERIFSSAILLSIRNYNNTMIYMKVYEKERTHEKNDFTEVFKNLNKYEKPENNFGSLK